VKGNTEDQYFRHADHVVSKRIDGRGVLLKLEDGYYFEVNEVGLDIWERCDGQHSVEKIMNQLSKKYGVSKNKISNDALDFINELSKRKLIKTTTPL